MNKYFIYIMNHQLVFTQTYKQVLFLIIAPCTTVFAFVIAILQVDNMPDWLILLLSFSIVGVNIYFGLKLFFVWMFVSCECRVNDKGLWLRITGRSPFYRKKETLICWDQIRSASLDENISEGTGKVNMKVYAHFKTVVSGYKKFMLFPQRGSGTIEEFWADASAYISQFNQHQTSAETQIKNIGYYQQKGIKALLVICLLMAAISILVTVFNLATGREIDWLMVLKALTFSGLFLVPYYVNKFRKKQP